MAPVKNLKQIRPNSQVLVLNASYEPLHITSWKRAIILLVKEKASIISAQVIRLVEYVRIPFSRISLIKPARNVIYKRDGHKCQYCGSTKDLTIDHVVPRSRGGGDTWDNMVTCCSPCNSRKGNKTLEQCGMKLVRQPAPPLSKFMFAITHSNNPEWKKYNFV
jgi:5-methylcytosine-specific restriction endonuclease McrA